MYILKLMNMRNKYNRERTILSIENKLHEYNGEYGSTSYPDVAWLDSKIMMIENKITQCDIEKAKYETEINELQAKKDSYQR